MSLYFSASNTLYFFSALAVVIFVLGFLGKLFLWTQGKAPGWHEKAFLRNLLRIFFRDIILQKQILQLSKVRWIMHMLIFTGFLGLLIQTSLLAFCSHVLPLESSLVLFIYKGKGKLILDFWGDLFGLFMMVGLLIAFTRRFVLKPEQLDTIYGDVAVLVLLFLIGLTGFFCEGVRMSQVKLVPVMGFSFIGYPLALLLKGLHLDGLRYHDLVWVHAVVSLMFIAWIPFSKMVHLVTTPAEILMGASQEASEKQLRK